MNLKGTIEFVKTVEKGNKKFYSFKVGDKWYGSGIKSPGNKGDTIEFDVEENGSFLNAGNIKKVEGASVTNQAGASSTSGSTDWAAKDRSIAWQAARNSANALLAVGANVGYQDFPDSFTKLLAKSDELTLKFFNSSQSPGGTTEAKKVQKPSPQEDDSDPFHDDTIPF